MCCVLLRLKCTHTAATEPDKIDIHIYEYSRTNKVYIHRVHEKNYKTVYVAITLANNVGF